MPVGSVYILNKNKHAHWYDLTWFKTREAAIQVSWSEGHIEGEVRDEKALNHQAP